MHSGKQVALGLVIFGVAFLAINGAMLYFSNSYLPKLLVVGINIIFVGIGFFIAPGPDIPLEDNKAYFKLVWKESTWQEKMIWFIFICLGIAATVFVYKYFGLSL